MFSSSEINKLKESLISIFHLNSIWSSTSSTNNGGEILKGLHLTLLLQARRQNIQICSRPMRNEEVFNFQGFRTAEEKLTRGFENAFYDHLSGKTRKFAAPTRPECIK